MRITAKNHARINTSAMQMYLLKGCTIGQDGLQERYIEKRSSSVVRKEA